MAKLVIVRSVVKVVVVAIPSPSAAGMIEAGTAAVQEDATRREKTFPRCLTIRTFSVPLLNLNDFGKFSYTSVKLIIAK